MSKRARGFWPGVGVGVAISLAAGGVLHVARAQPAAAQAPAKYSSKIVLENDKVRVKDVTFPPGVLDTGMHTHDLAHVGVILTKGALVFTDPDGKSERVGFDAGSVGYRGPRATHQVANPGPSPMRVIEVELKFE